jgi:hypothetical protein
MTVSSTRIARDYGVESIGAHLRIVLSTHFEHKGPADD